jgi:demethylmenaquinone methyltransferase/2-methoxy-6-polyprenyl-1,4-benzoquinol methylase
MDSETEKRNYWNQDDLRHPHVQPEKSEKVRIMFDGIARRYDLANTILSVGQHHRWRKTLAGQIHKNIQNPKRIIDLCCGTGSMMKALQTEFSKTTVVGLDFSTQMLQICKKKYVKDGMTFVCADAERIPLADSIADIVTCVFGLRNLQSLENGVSEVRRILKPGGIFAILEFQPPQHNVLGRLFSFYFNVVLPHLGSLITSGRKFRAYDYLARSVEDWFTDRIVIQCLEKNGFSELTKEYYCFNSVCMITARNSRK